MSWTSWRHPGNRTSYDYVCCCWGLLAYCSKEISEYFNYITFCYVVHRRFRVFNKYVNINFWGRRSILPPRGLQYILREVLPNLRSRLYICNMKVITCSCQYLPSMGQWNQCPVVNLNSYKSFRFRRFEFELISPDEIFKLTLGYSKNSETG